MTGTASQTYAKYMYRLFAAAQAREFSVGCQAKWSNFVDKSNAFPFASTAGLSGPRRPTRAKVLKDLGLEGAGACLLMGFLLASKVVASVLPAVQPKTRKRLLYEPVATRVPSPLRQHSNLSKIESFSYKSHNLGLKYS